MAYLKFKACRRLGENLWAVSSKKLTPKQNTIIKLVIKKNTSRKQSDFSKKLQQLKKLAYFYGMPSLNLNTRAPGCRLSETDLDKKKSLLLTLETRLDVILVRLFFCSTLFAARQLITHNKIRINLNIVNVPGFTVRNGDIISMSKNFPVRASARLQLAHLVKSKMKAVLTAPGRMLSGKPALANSKMQALLAIGGTGLPNVAVPGGTLRAIRERPFAGVGGLYHFEVNYKTFNAVLLYEPIQIHFPYKIDLDLLF